jgi:hypothetical protein
MVPWDRVPVGRDLERDHAIALAQLDPAIINAASSSGSSQRLKGSANAVQARRFNLRF